MTRVTLVVCATLLTVASVAVLAQRHVTNPKPEPYLKQLFPEAVAFSPLEGTPLHYKAYAVDPAKTPGAKPIGYAFWTTDVTPKEYGYHGPIFFIVGLNLQGRITGAILDFDTEPYGYFSIQPKKFGAKFVGKSVRDPFRVGEDVDAVSRASISVASATRAIRDGSRIMARQFLNPADVK